MTHKIWYFYMCSYLSFSLTLNCFYVLWVGIVIKEVYIITIGSNNWSMLNIIHESFYLSIDVKLSFVSYIIVRCVSLVHHKLFHHRKQYFSGKVFMEILTTKSIYQFELFNLVFITHNLKRKYIQRCLWSHVGVWYDNGDAKKILQIIAEAT